MQFFLKNFKKTIEIIYNIHLTYTVSIHLNFHHKEQLFLCIITQIFIIHLFLSKFGLQISYGQIEARYITHNNIIVSQIFGREKFLNCRKMPNFVEL